MMIAPPMLLEMFKHLQILRSPDLSQQVQVAMESMLKMINEIDENSTGIMEEIVNCKVNALNRKKTLGEQNENFQKLHSLFWTCSTTRILHEVVISSTIFLCQALLIRYKTFMRL